VISFGKQLIGEKGTKFFGEKAVSFWGRGLGKIDSIFSFYHNF
jgi:hypothetical protein